MNQNWKKNFTKKLNKKQKEFKADDSLSDCESMFSRIPIETFLSGSRVSKNETLKKIDAALGLLKLKAKSKEMLE